jgi:hypothetical protein
LRRTLLCLSLALALATSSEARRQEKKPEAIAMKRAVEIALDAVKERLDRWKGGCRISVLPSGSDWSVQLEPRPMGPGLDVLVLVHPDGSTTLYPGF